MTHLWEVDHPYYMTEGNYFKTGCHYFYENLDEFLSAMGEADKDYNWLVRWDWQEGPGESDWVRPADRPDTYVDGVLMVQFIGQRKAMLWSGEVKVCRYDEPRVREYLEGYARYMATMWQPLELSADTEGRHD